MAYDFPASPSTGQVYQGWTYDGEKWLGTATAPNTAGVIKIQVFTSSGFYVPSPSMTSCVVECWGGGGGGGSVVGGTATNSLVGGGGGGGGYSRSMLTAAQIGTSQTVTIGAAGLHGAPGSAGGNTTFGIMVRANGGAGAVGSAYSQPGTLGGAAGTGDLAVPGPGAQSAIGDTSANLTISCGCVGASTTVGAGGLAGIASGNAAVGGNATGYGSGGGGAASNRSTNTVAGGDGSAGLVVITEYGMTALAAGSAQGNVRYDLPQGLTSNQMAQARANIGDLKKNYIINGAMMVSQENGATAGATTNYYAADCWKTSFSNAGTQSIAQVASSTPGGSPNRYRFTATAVDTSVGAGDNVQIQQIIEGLRVADLRFGSAAAKTVTLQFGVKAPAGTYCVALSNNAGNRSYVAEYVIAAGEANTDVVKSVTIPGDVTGTWLTDNTLGLVVYWALMCGSTYQQAAGSWGTVPFAFASSNQFNFMGTINNVFELFDVGLYEGSVAPPFMVPDYASELALCQRYFEIIGEGQSLSSATATSITLNAIYKTTKRSSPTISMAVTNPGVYFAGAYVTATGAACAFQAANGPNGAAIAVNGFAALALNIPGVSNASSFIKANARL